MFSFCILDNYLSIGLVIGLNVLLAVAQSELKLVNVVSAITFAYIVNDH